MKLTLSLFAVFTLLFSISSPVFAAQEITSKTLTVRKVTDTLDFEKLAIPSQGVIRQGKTLKFLIDNRKASLPEMYYLNASYCPSNPCSKKPEEASLHFPFAQKVLKNFSFTKDQYNQAAYFTSRVSTRLFFDGRIQQLLYTDKTGAEKEIYAVLFIERDVISEDLVKHALRVVQRNFIKDAPLVFVSNSTAQTVNTIKPWLAERKIENLTMEDLISNVKFIGLNPGVAYGFLRFGPANPEDLEAYEIPVFQELPLELAVVAGAITTSYQDVGSHVNLKSKERGTPNMVLRETSKIEALKALDGKPIKLTVTYQDFTIENSTPQEVMQAYQAKVTKPWVKPSYSEEKNLVEFDSMCRNTLPKDCLAKAKSYGGKVSGMGFLAHPEVTGMGSPLQKKLGYRLVPHGFGLPLAFYNDFIAHNVAKNPEFKQAMNELLESEMALNGRTPLPTSEKKQLIEKLKKLVLQGEIPNENYAAMVKEAKTLQAKIKSTEGIELLKVKVRSSSNTEDVEGFNGAGLHDSYSAKLKNMENQDFDCHYEMNIDEDTGLEENEVLPKTLSCATKGVYASLWNLGALRERSYRRFDHRFASMGVSVQPTYKYKPDSKISANSVLITRVVGTESVYGQQLSTQEGNGLVTNPVPGTKAELATISFDLAAKHIGINILQYAKPNAEAPPLTKTVMKKELMLLHSEIARTVEVKFCEAKPDYAPGRTCTSIPNSATKPQALDMEFKTFFNGEVLIKQVRTFSAH